MQGYNTYYQSPASMQASSSSSQTYMTEAPSTSAKYAYELPTQSNESYYSGEGNAARPFMYSHSRPSQTPSSGSSSSASTIPTLNLSPTSYGSSVSSSATTPITPLELTSPAGYKEGQTQDSWFAAMQESYLANNGQQLHQQSRPSLQRMQRMSISNSGPHFTPRSQQAGNQFLGVAGQPPRRASVATFQPTPSRMSQTPVRPAISTAANSEPILHSQNMREYRSASYQAPSGSQLRSEVPRQALSSIPQQSTSISEQASDVNKLYAEVFGGRPTQPMYQHQQASPSQYAFVQPMHSPVPIITAPAIYSPVGQYQPTSQMSPQTAPSDTYNNYAGVLLQQEDLHMLGTEPLSPTASHASPYMQPVYSAPNSGWQTSFSLSVPPPTSTQQQAFPAVPTTAKLQPALPVGGQSTNWNFASFHGFAPIVTPAVEMLDPFERPASAPPVEELQSMGIVGMDRRRGSSVDSAALLPFQPSVLQPVPASMTTPPRYSVGTPAYFGANPAHPSNLLVRRSTVGPTSLNLNPVPQGHYPPTPSPGSHITSLPSMPVTTAIDTSRGSKSPTTPSPTTRRAAGRSGSGGSRRSAGGTPMFINFTSKDANKLLSGVAPSGSSKRKREEEEAKASNGNTKMMRTDGSSTSSANGSPLA